MHSYVCTCDIIKYTHWPILALYTALAGQHYTIVLVKAVRYTTQAYSAASHPPQFTTTCSLVTGTGMSAGDVTYLSCSGLPCT